MVRCGNDFCSEFQDATVCRILLDDLHTLSSYFDAPVFFSCIRKVFTKCSEALFRRLQKLTYQILFESQVAHPDSHQRQNVVRINGAEEIEIGSMLEELC